MAPDLPGFIDCPKEAAFLDSTCLRPAVNRLFNPEWNWNRPDMSGLAVEVGNHPMLFPKLNGIERKRKKFAAPQATTDQKSKNGMVPLAPQTVALGLQQQRTTLLSSEPVP
jgi:hypothetical protein